MNFTKNLLKESTRAIALICIALFSFAFTHTTPNYIGTYKVSTDDPSNIRLEIRKDGHFYYQDFSNKSQKIKTKGKWVLKNKHIHLTPDKNLKFHSKWSFSKDGRTAKSRNGISFYTLRKT